MPDLNPQGCITKISKLILLWRLQPSVQRSWLEKKNYIILFFKSLPLLALVSPPSLSTGNFISYFCMPSFYLQICLVQLLRSLTHQCHLKEAIYRWVGGALSITLWIKSISMLDAGTGCLYCPGTWGMVKIGERGGEWHLSQEWERDPDGRKEAQEWELHQSSTGRRERG